MNILVAPNAFKGTYSAVQIAEFIAQGIQNATPSITITKIPMADGGDGTLDVLLRACHGTIYKKTVSGPLGKNVHARYAILKDNTAIIEMAEVSGLALLKLQQRNPILTTTYGVGQLIKAALSKNPKKIIVAVGGSATIDGGMGMAQALGVKFLDKDNKEIAFRKQQGYSGGSLEYMHAIDLSGMDRRIKKISIEVACDVTNPLYGKNGAAYIYGPQKGATSGQVRQLDTSLKRFSMLIKKQLGKNINIPGAGASGGLAGGLLAFTSAKLVSGIGLIIKKTYLETHIKKSKIVITGEGRLDSQSLHDKAVIGIAKLAKKHGKEVIAVCGSFGEGASLCFPYFDKIINVTGNSRIAIKDTPFLIRKKMQKTAQMW